MSKISKPVPVWKKSIEVDYKDFTKALSKGVADICFGKWDSLAGDGVDAAAALGLSAKSGEIGWWLVYRSLLRAMKKLVDERTELPPERFKPKELKVAIDLVVGGLNKPTILNSTSDDDNQIAILWLFAPPSTSFRK